MLGIAFYHSVQHFCLTVFFPNIQILRYTYLQFCLLFPLGDTWSLTFKEEPKMRVFKNRVLRKIFRPKRDEVTGEWRKLHNEELH